MKNNKFAVKVHNKYLNKAIQDLAIDNGYNFDSPDCYETSLGYLYLCFGTFKERGLGYTSNEEWLLDRFDTVFDALTDWQKIEEAMKLKEPRNIYVMENDGQLTTYFLNKEDTDNYHGKGIKFIKFIEVIE